jgi:hypothetical protein
MPWIRGMQQDSAMFDNRQSVAIDPIFGDGASRAIDQDARTRMRHGKPEAPWLIGGVEQQGEDRHSSIHIVGGTAQYQRPLLAVVPRLG